jgi:uncharacterized PurR-regulated membrane protein YhhQ (DUF165 family)
MIYPGVFLVSVVMANLLVGAFGPKASPIIAFFLIGLDLSLRDKLHESWHGEKLVLKMLALIAASGAITYVLNRNAGSIVIGSVVAFTTAMGVDALIYESLFHKKKILKMNASNVVSAGVDTVLFVWIAFGVFMWKIMLLQYLAKTVGGLAWSFILIKIGEKHNES